MLKKFFSGSFRNRLLLYFTVLMMMPLCIAGFMIYSVSDNKIAGSAIKLSGQIIEKDRKNIDQILSEMQTAGTVISTDEVIQNFVRSEIGSEQGNESVRKAIDDRLRQLTKLYGELDGVYLMLDDGMIAKSRYYSVLAEPLLTKEDYQNARNHANPKWFVNENGSLMVDNLGDSVLSMVQSFSNYATGQPCGVLVIEVRQSRLIKQMGDDFENHGAVFCIDPDNENILICSKVDGNPNMIHSAVSDIKEMAIGTKQETVIQSGKILICDRLVSTGWIVAGVVADSYLKSGSRQILFVFLISAFISFGVSIIISKLLTDYEMKPINRMNEYVHSVENGTFGKPLSPIRLDEIGKLTESIQEMSTHIGTLIDTVKTEQQRIRTAELKALQAQINPHFLYNSLDSINWLTRKGDIDNASAMISALTKFFRIGLSKGRDLITMKEEIEHVRNYMIIQKFRYQDKFDYSIYLDPLAENCLVPKLILQPLVENSLYHGIKVCGHKCALVINVIVEDKLVNIEVLDSGVGMSQETINELQKAMNHEGENKTNSYGIVNVNDRIQILAGTQYGLKYTSEEEIGTSAKIVLPIDLKGEALGVQSDGG